MGSCAERLEMHYKFNGGTSGQPSCSRTELCTRLSRKKATILGSVTELPTATYAVISQTRMMAFSRLKLLHPLYSWCWTMRRDSQWTVKFLVCSDPLSLTYRTPEPYIPYALYCMFFFIFAAAKTFYGDLISCFVHSCYVCLYELFRTLIYLHTSFFDFDICSRYKYSLGGVPYDPSRL
jgi:hypothetical protein